MTTVRMQNNLEGQGPIIAPVREDGRGYPYCMYFNNDVEVVFADKYAELLEVLMPGYGALDGLNQDIARIQLATSVAAQVQAQILASVDPASLTADELAVLSAPRSLEQPRADWWACEVPLVVVETAYAPYTEVPRPASALSDGMGGADNLWFVRPGEEEDFLVSLHEVGYIRLMENIADGEL